MAREKVITVMCAARLPEILVKRIDAAAESGGVSRAQFITEACRMRLDMAGDNSTRVGLGSQPEPAPKPNMAALREICAGKIQGDGSSDHTYGDLK